MAKLTRHDWIEAEELYKQGWTQRQIADKYKIRVETVSLHMKKASVKGGEAIDVVRQEMEAALFRKLKEFAAKRATRQIDTKEKFHTLVNSLLGFYVKELKNAQETGMSLDKMAGSARALKESIMGLKLAREELYTILEIKPETAEEDTPDLFVMTMNDSDEARIRGSGAYKDDEEEMDEAIAEDNLRHDLEDLEKGTQ